MSNRRERILLVVVIAIVGAFGAKTILNGVFFEPLERERLNQLTLLGAIEAKNEQVAAAQKANQMLAEWQKMSFSSDPGIAQSTCQELLYDLVEECDFDDEVVTSNPTQKGKFFTRLPFQLSGNASLKNLVKFLHKVYEPKRMIQVKMLDVHPIKDSSDLSIRINVEGLALNSAPVDPAEIEIEDNGGHFLTVDQAQLDEIVTRNIFQLYNEPRRVVSTPPPAVDVAKHVRVTGSTQAGEDQHVWLYNRLENKTTYLRQGETFDIGGIRGKLTQLAPGRATVEFDGKLWSLPIGKSLREMEQLGTTPTGSNPDPEAKKPVEQETSTEEKPKVDAG